ncbi:hypothetical protein E2C01_051248 [Portunus trituberculatus]|uniref:Uncharacterized protein n=1 Tax=Portunus trituberculatus TaxID=210409 RepID=A0A5B7GAG5_PORTR|nr:hypothetical protein [Portunus trituberculatus]
MSLSHRHITIRTLQPAGVTTRPAYVVTTTTTTTTTITTLGQVQKISESDDSGSRRKLSCVEYQGCPDDWEEVGWGHGRTGRGSEERVAGRGGHRDASSSLTAKLGRASWVLSPLGGGVLMRGGRAGRGKGKKGRVAGFGRR